MELAVSHRHLVGQFIRCHPLQLRTKMYPEELKIPPNSREGLAPPASWRRATCLVGCWRAREGGWLHLDMMVMVAF